MGLPLLSNGTSWDNLECEGGGRGAGEVAHQTPRRKIKKGES